MSYDGGTPQPLANPTGPPGSPVWTPTNPCAGSSLTRKVVLDFTSFAGLTLGTQTSSVSVIATNGEVGAGTYPADCQAPVLVTPNWEPSDDPATGTAIQKDTLVVVHIASSSVVD